MATDFRAETQGFYRVIDREFNDVVCELSARNWPKGFDISGESAPANYEALVAEYDKRGRITVDTNNSRFTIFGDEETNWKFRAWHDAHHIRGGFNFSSEGERLTAQAQIAELCEQYPGDPKLPLWCALVDIEVNGQLQHLESTGVFPIDQYQFAVSELRKRGFNV